MVPLIYLTPETHISSLSQMKKYMVDISFLASFTNVLFLFPSKHTIAGKGNMCEGPKIDDNESVHNTAML